MTGVVVSTTPQLGRILLLLEVLQGSGHDEVDSSKG